MRPVRPYLCDECGHEHYKCTGHKKKIRPKVPCGGQVVKGSETCRMHNGGHEQFGPSNGNWKGGTTSRMFGGATPELLGAFELALNDPDLQSLNKEIATLEARTQQLLQRLRGGAKSEHWETAARLIEIAHDDSKKPEEKAAAMMRCREILREGAADQAVWMEVYAVQEQRRKLAETEGKNSERLNQTMTAQHAMALLAAAVGSIKKHVSDRETLRKIALDMRLIAMGGNGAQSRDADAAA